VSRISEARRKAVELRAGFRCEYCLLSTRGQVATFPVDHIIPASSGGSNELDNLALSCPHCNAHKWNQSSGVHPVSHEIVSFFNPRLQIWADHFEWSTVQIGEVVGITEIGKVTILGLKINDRSMIRLRQLLAEFDLFDLIGQ